MNERQKEVLLKLASDLSRHDEKIISQMKNCLDSPPRTSEQVGFYLSGKESDFENCFRFLIKLIMNTPYCCSCEDKYALEVADLWLSKNGLVELPEVFLKMAPNYYELPMDGIKEENLDSYLMSCFESHFLNGVKAIEKQFWQLGTPLMSIEKGEGDTMVFVCVTPDMYKAWENVKLGKTYQETPLGLTAPNWYEFWYFAVNTLGLNADAMKPPLDPSLNRNWRESD